MDLQKLKNIIEAILLSADKPMDIRHIESMFEIENERPTKDEIRQAVKALQDDYQGRGIELKEISSGYRMQVSQEYAPWVGRLWEEKPARYSRALLETLVLIAYRQPITRGEIEEIRGVSVSTHIAKTLLDREWIRVLGHKDVPGKPAMYGTTKEFLDYFNLKSLDEMPPLSEIKDLDKIHPELALEGDEADSESSESDQEPSDELASVENASGSETLDEGDQQLSGEIDESTENPDVGAYQEAVEALQEASEA
ncbi:MAG: SMC-Scp complex subunit ScpB [Gammaproteobacteria bacterium]|nr:SMC-Scp complex subunit ScpB [Gammaproteobacteria bacterium]MCW9056960.1 SMC-Scp complex subunit ScpB [Gammaproteobacteria bacterium]